MIVRAGQRAPSACNLQTYSIIWVRDEKLKDRVLDASKVSDSIRSAPVVLVICADIRRLSLTLDHLRHEHCLRHGYGYALKAMSIIDACLVAENMTLAAECLGLGSVFIGTAFANKELIEALKLPPGALPLMLLCIGYPDEKPPIRPRLPIKSILHVDEYREPTDEEIDSFLKIMDEELRREGYYQKYSGQGEKYDYTEHIKRKTSVKDMEKEESEIISVLKATGFLPSQ